MVGRYQVEVKGEESECSGLNRESEHLHLD